MRPLRVYVDTSVIGGCFDEDFTVDSRRLINDAKGGRLLLLVSDVVLAELRNAPAAVEAVLLHLPLGSVEIVPHTPEVDALRDAYIAARVVARRSIDDATHVAAAPSRMPMPSCRGTSNTLSGWTR